MTTVELLTSQALEHGEMIAKLKSAETDEQFVSSLLEFGRDLGFSVTHEEIIGQMHADRQAAKEMSEEEFESVAGTMLGARLSGGHQSGSNC